MLDFLKDLIILYTIKRNMFFAIYVRIFVSIQQLRYFLYLISDSRHLILVFLRFDYTLIEVKSCNPTIFLSQL